MKGLRSHVLSHGATGIGAALEGWRATLLGPPLAKFALEFPLKS
jgi:hypothetical protein